MTVKELMSILSRAPKDAEVKLSAADEPGCHDNVGRVLLMRSYENDTFDSDTLVIEAGE